MGRILLVPGYCLEGVALYQVSVGMFRTKTLYYAHQSLEIPVRLGKILEPGPLNNF